MKLVEEGTWMFGDQLMFVQKWTKNLSIVTGKIKKVGVWVKIYDIPLEFWSEKGFSYIASGLGHLLYLDSVTTDGTRLEFARICIEMEVDECSTQTSLTSLFQMERRWN